MSYLLCMWVHFFSCSPFHWGRRPSRSPTLCRGFSSTLERTQGLVSCPPLSIKIPITTPPPSSYTPKAARKFWFSLFSLFSSSLGGPCGFPLISWKLTYAFRLTFVTLFAVSLSSLISTCNRFERYPDLYSIATFCIIGSLIYFTYSFFPYKIVMEK